jgi:hypothetical protein
MMNWSSSLKPLISPPPDLWGIWYDTTPSSVDTKFAATSTGRALVEENQERRRKPLSNLPANHGVVSQKNGPKV